MKPLTFAIIAGEPSGDYLGADLVIAIRQQLQKKTCQQLELVGVGGDELKKQGLSSLFDFSEISIVGIGAVLARLPKLIWRIRQTAKKILAANPDILIIIDSPDFTHRVARIIRQKRPDIPIINYVCPSVWAWKPERAEKMCSYIDHVLSILPFEPEVVADLKGPPLTYIGHRLIEKGAVKSARKQQINHQLTDNKTFLLLPGSRSGELKRHLEVVKLAAIDVSDIFAEVKFFLPTIPRFEQSLKKELASWPLAVEVVVSEEEKLRAFACADAALAASGTILLELALMRIPCISIYKSDIFVKILRHKITIWTAALPNLIVGYPAVSENYDASISPLSLAKRLARLATNTHERVAILDAFDQVHARMQVDKSPGELAANIILNHIK